MSDLRSYSEAGRGYDPGDMTGSAEHTFANPMGDTTAHNQRVYAPSEQTQVEIRNKDIIDKSLDAMVGNIRHFAALGEQDDWFQRFNGVYNEIATEAASGNPAQQKELGKFKGHFVRSFEATGISQALQDPNVLRVYRYYFDKHPDWFQGIDPEKLDEYEGRLALAEARYVEDKAIERAQLNIEQAPEDAAFDSLVDSAEGAIIEETDMSYVKHKVNMDMTPARQRYREVVGFWIDHLSQKDKYDTKHEFKQAINSEVVDSMVDRVRDNGAITLEETQALDTLVGMAQKFYPQAWEGTPRNWSRGDDLTGSLEMTRRLAKGQESSTPEQPRRRGVM